MSLTDAQTQTTVSLTHMAGEGNNGPNSVGTWVSADEGGPVSIGGMTLAPDGTYTAFAVYGEETRGFSGKWMLEGTDLVLDAGRRYGLEKMEDGTVHLTDPASGTKSALRRAS
jgi:hypothetical protein